MRKIYDVVAKSQLKKILKIFTREQHKVASASAKEKEDAELRTKNIEDAKKVCKYSDFCAVIMIH